jgi:hypothetical protein
MILGKSHEKKKRKKPRMGVSFFKTPAFCGHKSML